MDKIFISGLRDEVDGLEVGDREAMEYISGYISAKIDVLEILDQLGTPVVSKLEIPEFVGEAEIGVIKKEEQHSEEQLYKVIIPDPEKKSQARVNGLMRTEDNRINIGNINKEAFRTNRENVCLTEEEIKRNHSYLWEFAMPAEEPKYIVPLKGLCRDGRQVFLIKDAIYRSDNLDWSKEEYLRYNVDDYALTEEEIKNIDWAYWDFAVPVDLWLKGEND